MLTRLAAIIIGLLFLATYVPAQKSRGKRDAVPPPPPVTQKEARDMSDAASKSRSNLIEASKSYRESLEHLLELQKQEEERAAALVEKDHDLFTSGVISKKEVEQIEQKLSDAQNKIAVTQRQLESVDRMVAEVRAAEELAKNPGNSSAMLVRYVGSSHWAMSDLDKIDAFFRLKFGRVLPVSALGQTETHSLLGFDHREAVDVAVHPDSPEGQALMNYLRSQKISFIAIRGPIPGSATGAHIHIGPASKRLSIVKP